MPRRAPTYKPPASRYKTKAKEPVSQRRLSPSKRGYGAGWQKLRITFIKSHPLCLHCEREGITAPAEEVDHIRPLSDGGTNDWANLQPLCKSHHSKKTYRESLGRPKTLGYVS